MKCEICGVKDVAKAVKIRKDGHAVDIFVCDDCAKRLADSGTLEAASGAGKAEKKDKTSGLSSVTDVLMNMKHVKPAELGDFLQRIWGMLGKEPSGEKGGDSRPKCCPVCGLTRDLLVENREFGCSRCYEVFADEAAFLMRQLQIGDAHTGRMPHRLETSAKASKLRADLSKALREERYEDAAKLHAALRKLRPGDDELSSPKEGKRDE